MIEINGIFYTWNDPIILAAAAAVIVVLVLFITLRAVLKSAKAVEPMMMQMGQLNQTVQNLGAGQSQLTGGLESLSKSQTMTIQTMEVRLAEVQRQMAEKLHESSMKSARSLSDLQERMNDTLHGSSEKTTKSLTQLQERLATIDRAQSNIEKLSGDVLSLQDILSNKQRRGMFGEIQLNDIVSKALPANAYQMQATLSNGKRADCLIHLPNPPGPIVIDAKFPFEAFEMLAAAEGPEQTKRALRDFGAAVRVHIKAISEKYILDGETADGALMFLPSEAIYAELHARLPEVVREGFAARVWIVSPTTCMATLNTMRAILKDARMREQAGAIRRELGLLYKDVDRLGTRVENLDRHFGQAAKDISEIKISAEKAGTRARRLDTFEFDEPDEAIETVPPVARIVEP
ncbi:DNA recombination protein RmuC [Litoreibacter ponti]|uniref:DNA recombination protein RmuC homolog n=1 Tax=Litoreibacter ponti TaxID=1510457 RepID=A0A2T6BNM7_9RHOB|nr:DNA recombination protein RmuC [Litoreibacter ponti]PTX57652.1 DNA recombination protein RmuC [Litoreibacter ponti]